ncbi:MAG: hypothetical protein Q8908_03185 [Bacteroidota bacterium]|nr:hypothetical protein [Bacteroidota bacterium]
MRKLPAFFYNDSYKHGILLAFVIPLLSAIPIFPLLNGVKAMGWIDPQMSYSKYLLLCCIPNFIAFRQYVKVLQMEKTSKAIFIVSLVEVALLIILSNRSIF